MSKALIVEEMGVRFDEFLALDGVSIAVEQGESFGLVGNPVQENQRCCGRLPG